ncbi:hypothetical protein EVAR_52063_1 [Eumeta japonica]|uniref:Uncharacterized protein n=1 Tax=Eumeta variegata TaxID=151549 RepID=A0A4C1Z7G8_EUMVA|nr:hypothetical protein EVAR_52063_1 [Eumeta japonica]
MSHNLDRYINLDLAPTIRNLRRPTNDRRKRLNAIILNQFRCCSVVCAGRKSCKKSFDSLKNNEKSMLLNSPPAVEFRPRLAHSRRLHVCGRRGLRPCTGGDSHRTCCNKLYIYACK